MLNYWKLANKQNIASKSLHPKYDQNQKVIIYLSIFKLFMSSNHVYISQYI